ncbi:MAG: hypothetical protein IAI50_06160 [Candidatus Eremiobacteraeota bacterium]|nr:hypothetical protein [Candidatus Eremiobacteraeota bacterium]
MDDRIGNRILRLLDVISIEVGAVRNDVRLLDAKVVGLEVKIDRLDVKLDRLDVRAGRAETRVEGVETEVRSFRREFIAPLEHG